VRKPSVSSERNNNVTQKGARKENYVTLQEIQDIDRVKAEEFVGKVLGDASDLTATLLAGIGDRLGCLRTLRPTDRRPAQNWRLARA
jgi:hypothetical protein